MYPESPACSQNGCKVMLYGYRRRWQFEKWRWPQTPCTENSPSAAFRISCFVFPRSITNSPLLRQNLTFARITLSSITIITTSRSVVNRESFFLFQRQFTARLLEGFPFLRIAAKMTIRLFAENTRVSFQKQSTNIECPGIDRAVSKRAFRNKQYFVLPMEKSSDNVLPCQRLCPMRDFENSAFPFSQQ